MKKLILVGFILVIATVCRADYDVEKSTDVLLRIKETTIAGDTEKITVRRTTKKAELEALNKTDAELNGQITNIDSQRNALILKKESVAANKSKVEAIVVDEEKAPDPTPDPVVQP